METLYYYWWYYQKTAHTFWDTLGPREYATILSLVGVIGWLLMKSNLKR
jgi:hypothetical protein